MKDNWIKVEDQKPPDVTPVFVYFACCNACHWFEVAEIENGKWFESNSGNNLEFKPTHWQPTKPPTQNVDN